MDQHPWEVQKATDTGDSGRLIARLVLLVCGGGVIVGLFVLHGLDRSDRVESPPTLSANRAPSTTTPRVPVVTFGDAIAARIREEGRVTATIHVALMAGDQAGRAGRFGDGASPRQNLYWGALFGIETHPANAAGWRRVHTDAGDGERILRRVVFHKRAGPTPSWAQRGVEEAFDLYVLACAWSHHRIKAAMEQPLRDAMCGQSVTIAVDGKSLRFGGGGNMSGYVGQNAMLDAYWNPFEDLEDCKPLQQAGVFYVCPRSAVVLHRPVQDQGLYSILFTRSTIIPEAYLVDGLLEGLISGELDDAFVTGAARAYARYQKSVSLEHAMSLLLR